MLEQSKIAIHQLRNFHLRISGPLRPAYQLEKSRWLVLRSPMFAAHVQIPDKIEVFLVLWMKSENGTETIKADAGTWIPESSPGDRQTNFSNLVRPSEHAKIKYFIEAYRTVLKRNITVHAPEAPILAQVWRLGEHRIDTFFTILKMLDPRCFFQEDARKNGSEQVTERF